MATKHTITAALALRHGSIFARVQSARRFVTETLSTEWKEGDSNSLASERAGDSRGTLLLSITAPGRSALLAWACDPIRSASVGLDPFRLRSGIWRTLSDAKRKAALKKIAVEIQRNVDFLNSYIRDLDGIEMNRI